MDRPDWQAHAACRDLHPDVFFDGPLGRAKAVCATCTVKADCLAYALPDPSLLGVWGGTTERQRRPCAGRPPQPTGSARALRRPPTVPTAGQVPSG